MTKHRGLIRAAVSLCFCATILLSEAMAQQATPGYNNKIPESIMTPDKVKTRLGTLKFFDGIPTKETAALLFETLDLNRGVEAFLSGMPASNFEAGRRGHIALGQKNSNQMVIFDELMDSNSLFLTGNAGTVYITSFLDLKKDGQSLSKCLRGRGRGSSLMRLRVTSSILALLALIGARAANS